MNEELNEQVQVEEVELPEGAEVVDAVYERGEKYYVVKTEEFLQDYDNLKVEKEEALVKGLEELDKRVEEKLNALRPEIVEEVKKEIKQEINNEYDEKLAFYAKYLEEVYAEPIEEKQEEIVEEEQVQEENVQPEQFNA